MNQLFERLDEQISVAQDEPAVRSTLQSLAHDAGFDAYLYLSFQAETQMAVSNYPEEWKRRCSIFDMRRIDPVIRTAIDRQPLLGECWDRPDAQGSTEGLS